MKGKKTPIPNTINKAFKYHLEPTKEQESFFWACFFGVKFVWNQMLGDRMQSYKVTGKATQPSPASYKTDNPWLKEADSLALASVYKNLVAAYKRFFKQEKHTYSKKTVARAKRLGKELTFYDLEGHPKFKSRHGDNWKSYTTFNQNGTVDVGEQRIKLPKIGWVRCKVHRPIPDGAKICSATVSVTPTGKYYVSVLVEIEHHPIPVEPHNAIGLDFSMSELFVDHDGNCPSFPKPYRTAEEKLAKAQRRLSHMTKGGSNYKKQKRRIAAIHEKVANRRKDFLHKQSDSITKNYDTVCVEDLDMKAMSKALKFGKSVGDNGWGMFTRMLAYKQAWAGHHCVKIDRWFPSSKLCHVCGTVYANLTLKEREWTCEGCGTHHNRDHNAAINIRAEGFRMLALSQSA